MPPQVVLHIGANADLLAKDADQMLDDNPQHSKASLPIAQPRATRRI
jgi:hypothetical protein